MERIVGREDLSRHRVISRSARRGTTDAAQDATYGRSAARMDVQPGEVLLTRLAEPWGTATSAVDDEAAALHERRCLGILEPPARRCRR